MYSSKYNQEIINPNEITKGEFDELNQINDFDKFTEQEVLMVTNKLTSLIKKAETDEISAEEEYDIKSTTAELKSLTKYTINEMVDGRIVKSNIFCSPKQVKWEDTLEKSETGEKIEKGIFLDTELNRELDRVGVTFEKGKASVKKADEEPEVKEEEDDDSDEGMMKAAMAFAKKGSKDKMMKCLNKAYGSIEKADVEVEINSDEEEDDKEDKEEKGKKKA